MRFVVRFRDLTARITVVVELPLDVVDRDISFLFRGLQRFCTPTGLAGDEKRRYFMISFAVNSPLIADAQD